MRICDNGVMRDMSEEEEYIANHLPNPEEQTTPEELLSIITGEAE